jgi:hypothetical protein
MRDSILKIMGVFLIFMLGILNPPSIRGEEKKDMGGWEKGGKYDMLYDVAEFESFKGVVTKVTKVVPMPGMSPGVALVVRERREGEEILVHVCPEWFANAKKIGIRKGTKVHVKGVFAEIDDEDIFMASKVKTGAKEEFKVRLTKDGTPFWTMTPEELARERASN